MGLILGAIQLFCLMLISVKAEQSEPGQLEYLRLKSPVSQRVFAAKRPDGTINGCSCANKMCSCCAHLDVPHVIDEEACVNISYVSKDLGFKLDVILGGKVIYSGDISVKNPPPICIGIPFVKKYAKICLDLYDIQWRKHVGGCVKIQVRLIYVIRKDFNLGCFNFTNLDEESRDAVSSTLLGLKVHQMMVRAMKHEMEEKVRVMV